MDSFQFWKLLYPLRMLGREEAQAYLSSMQRTSPMLYERFMAWMISGMFALHALKGEPIVLCKTPSALERVWMLKSIRQDIPWAVLEEIMPMFAQDESALVRGAVIEQMILFSESKHFEPMLTLLHTDSSAEVREKCAQALVYARFHHSFPLALALMVDQVSSVRLATVPFFHKMPDQLEILLGDSCALVRRKALDFSVKCFDPANLKRVLQIALKDRDENVCYRASELWRDHVTFKQII